MLRPQRRPLAQPRNTGTSLEFTAIAHPSSDSITLPRGPITFSRVRRAAGRHWYFSMRFHCRVRGWLKTTSDL